MFGNTAVHASFGDAELAQMTLRAAIQEGLDFEQALQDPELPGKIQQDPQRACKITPVI